MAALVEVEVDEVVGEVEEVEEGVEGVDEGETVDEDEVTEPEAFGKPWTKRVMFATSPLLSVVENRELVPRVPA